MHPIQIKKYGNRRLYSSSETRFITIEELATAVRQGNRVQVTDADTGEDITSEILTQILLESRRAQHFPIELLEQMIRVNERTIRDFWSIYLEQSFKMVESLQESFRALQDKNPLFQWMMAGKFDADRSEQRKSVARRKQK